MKINIDVEGKPQTHWINKNNIDDYKLSKYRRPLRPSQVESLKSAIRAGKHFHVPLAIIKEDNGYQVVDGQHRIVALQELIKKEHIESINVPVLVWEKNDIKDPRQIYAEVNKGVKETLDDYINAYKNEIKIYKWMTEKDSFPVDIDIKKGVNKVKFRTLICAYLGIQNERVVQHDFSNSRRNCMIDLLKSLDSTDFENLKDFMSFFTNVFGKPGQGNWFYGLSGLTTFCRIYFDNRNIIGIKQMKEDFKRHILPNKVIMDYARCAAHNSTWNCYTTTINKLNEKREKKLYIKKNRKINDKKETTEEVIEV